TKNHEPITENTAWENGSWNSNYSTSKFLAEREVWRGIAEGLNAVIVNPTLILGGGNWNEGTPQFFSKIWKGLPFYTEGGAGFVAAADVARVMIQLMESDIHSERFILNSEHYSYKDLFSIISDLLGKRKPYINVKPWMMSILWREEMLKYRLTGLPPL